VASERVRTNDFPQPRQGFGSRSAALLELRRALYQDQLHLSEQNTRRRGTTPVGRPHCWHGCTRRSRLRYSGVQRLHHTESCRLTTRGDTVRHARTRQIGSSDLNARPHRPQCSAVRLVSRLSTLPSMEPSISVTCSDLCDGGGRHSPATLVLSRRKPWCDSSRSGRCCGIRQRRYSTSHICRTLVDGPSGLRN